MNNTARYDIYAFIHKGLRAFMAHTLVRVGRLDPLDAAEVAEVGAELRALLATCQGHLQHENDFVHAAMEARSPGSSSRIAHEHLEHEESIAMLGALLDRLATEPAAAPRLYRALAAFVAHNLEHMSVEESEHNAVLWATYSDEELMGIEQRIVASLSPEEGALTMRWILPHLSPAERAGMLAGVRAHAPAEAFDGMLCMVRPLLGGREWLKLSQALALPA